MSCFILESNEYDVVGTAWKLPMSNDVSDLYSNVVR